MGERATKVTIVEPSHPSPRASHHHHHHEQGTNAGGDHSHHPGHDHHAGHDHHPGHDHHLGHDHHHDHPHHHHTQTGADGETTTMDMMSRHHHDQHRKSVYHVVPHSEFYQSEESEDEEHVHHYPTKKPRSRRYYENLKEQKRHQKMMLNLRSKEKRQAELKSQIDECKAQQSKKDSLKSKGYDSYEEEEEESNFSNVMARNIFPPSTQPKIMPPRIIIRKDGVKVFAERPRLSKPKPPRPFTKAEIRARRHCSNVLISIPPAVDETDRDERRSNRLVQKTIRYIKRSWYVKINRKNSMKEISHRLNQRLYHARPVDSWLKRRDREKLAESSGFYSSTREHFIPLGNLETDTAMLVFENIPPDLRVTPKRWLRAIDDKMELQRKRATPLPRLPRSRVRRPSYSIGKIKDDAGGQKIIDEFVKVAEMFQKSIKGTQTYANLLEKWRQHKEDEAANRASPFGILRRQNAVENTIPTVPIEDKEDNDAPMHVERKTKRDSFAIDDRTFQREMHYLEKMMSAMYDIIKSLLNISPEQITSKLPLPSRAVRILRDRSPDSKEKESRKTPLSVLRAAVNPDLYTPALSADQSIKGIHEFVRTALATQEDIDTGLDEDVEEKIIELTADGEPRRPMATDGIPYMPTTSMMKSKVDLKSVLLDPSRLTPEDVINMRPPQSSKRALEAIKIVHSLKDERDHRLNLSAEQKIGRVFEDPDHAYKRTARNEATYLKLFHPGKKIRKPIWHRLKLGRLQDTGTKTTDAKEKTMTADIVTSQADTNVIVEQALIKRKNIQSRRFPDEDNIKTPNLPGAKSEEVLTSEEQSRLNLLKKAPDAAEVVPPPTPIRRLYQLAGIKTTEKDFYRVLMEMKRPFRNTEKKLRMYYENEIDRFEWDTMKRYRVKLKAITASPIYQKTIYKMRQAMRDAGVVMEQTETSSKRAAPWYRALFEKAETGGAFLHHGCQSTLMKLQKYCDVDLKSRPHMLSRFCLLVISMPVTELGETHWQEAICFLLQELFGAPVELFHHWLRYRNLPYLL